ncbi:MAG: hypothetical protein H0T46_22720 [Deltaproteobacteria bacterium]|nr:hypothetical protein [Deltaproteobacteria bacterium]
MRSEGRTDAPSAPEEETLESIVALATEVGAAAVSRDARELSAALDDARYRVAIVGPPTVAQAQLVESVFGEPIEEVAAIAARMGLRVRYGRSGSHVKVYRPSGEWMRLPLTALRRVSAANHGFEIVELVSGAAALAAGVSISVHARGLNTIPETANAYLVAAPDVARVAIGCPILAAARWGDVADVIRRGANESGAARVEPQRRALERHLCSRLQHHIAEHHRALHRSPHELVAWTNGLTLARILCERVLDKRRREPDMARDELERWLAREQRKFVMSTKADAIVTLRRRLETASARDLRHVGHEVAREIADDLALDLRRMFARQVQAAATHDGTRLVRDLREIFGTLPEVVPPEALAGLDLLALRAYRIERGPGLSRTSLVDLVGRIRLAGRRRFEERAEAQLAEELERVSAAWVHEARTDYDVTSAGMEMRFIALLDAAIETGRCAALFVYNARQQGQDGVAWARHRIAHWSALLSDLVAQLQ